MAPQQSTHEAPTSENKSLNQLLDTWFVQHATLIGSLIARPLNNETPANQEMMATQKRLNTTTASILEALEFSPAGDPRLTEKKLAFGKQLYELRHNQSALALADTNTDMQLASSFSKIALSKPRQKGHIPVRKTICKN